MTEPRDRKTERRKDKRLGAASAATGKKTRVPRKATARHLENSALYYLQRFATSAENLRRVLLRKVNRSAHYHGTDADEGRAHVDGLIERFLKSGLLDDGVFAQARAASLHRRGNSARMIRAKLWRKGVADEDIDAALEALGKDVGGDGGDADLRAAVNFARRRRLGPYFTGKESQDTREKQLAALARAGFSYDVARRVIEAESVDDICDPI